jgi:hypothetical protein
MSGSSTRSRRMVPALALGLALMSALPSLALAAPKGIFAKFARCPTREPGVAICEYVEVTGGSFSIGKASVPIDRPLVLQGGAVPTGGANFNEYFLVPPTGGQSISTNELELAGGLQALLGHSLSGKTASNTVLVSIESAATATDREIFNLAAALEEKGATVTLPVRLQLRNQLLGSACYLGSEAQPIELRLSDGTTSPPPPNRPIAGTLGKGVSEIEHGYEAFTDPGLVVVDNTFSVPVASGCGGSLAWLVDPEIDQALGLPSAAGRNAAILKNVLHQAETEAVLASEAFPA